MQTNLRLILLLGAALLLAFPAMSGCSDDSGDDSAVDRPGRPGGGGGTGGGIAPPASDPITPPGTAEGSQPGQGGEQSTPGPGTTPGDGTVGYEPVPANCTQAVGVDGLDGGFCQIPCDGQGAFCPPDRSGQGSPQCALDDGSGSFSCALICDPATGGCPPGGACQSAPGQDGVGICTWEVGGGDPGSGGLPPVGYAPSQENCAQAIGVEGVEGVFCDHACDGAGSPCPRDVSGSGQPQCVLQSPAGMSCALICQPATPDCPSGASCEQVPDQPAGVCVWPAPAQ
ncbi:MAG: hypothetical protein EA398_17630 [Deltaproteobacteria bacterium]|nr:MAG: hypothetical protein EA398_17630 [Deltaproteobacteria bacterium]